MKSGFKILWTDFALKELEETIDYLQEKWTAKELSVLFLKLEETLSLIAQNPNLFQVSDVKKEVRRVVILKHNTLYYRHIKPKLSNRRFEEPNYLIYLG
jgi:plasmid stabilization system protein ParE